MHRILRFALVAGLWLLPVVAAAQPRWDVAGTAGLLAAHSSAGEGEGYREEWFQAAHGGVTLGRYLTRHLKVEFEASATGEGAQLVARRVDVPGLAYPHWIVTEVRTSVRSLGGVLAWQFRDNEWVHPFVAIGLSADEDRVSVYTPEQFFYGDSRLWPQPIQIGEAGLVEMTTWHVRPVVTGGAKLYFLEQAFVRTDARITWARDRQDLVLRAGIGVDF